MTRIRTAAEAEVNAAEQMRLLGYADATALPGGADGGIDVYSSQAYAQVKWRGGTAGTHDLENLYGARGTSRSRELLYFSRAGYTDDAREYANAVGIALFGCEPDGDTPPVGDRALDLVSAARNSAARNSKIAAETEPPAVQKPASPAHMIAGNAWAGVARFLGAHWRIICAVLCTVTLLIAPFGEGHVALRVFATIVSVVGAPVFWFLYVQHRQASQRTR
ncbi:MAG: restriction endonuclease [Rhodococcus sp. (in: high G+C Gram-positive bacteria)]|uniref:restriction endonuclease n=1 Tax=Rhodococcus sp. TaxID=1831 RepID=UPI003BAFE5D4